MSARDASASLDRLLTLREAGAFLRFHPRTVLEFVRVGDLLGRKIGGRWRFSLQDLRRFYEEAPSGHESGAEVEEGE